MIGPVKIIHDEVQSITRTDDLEELHIDNVINWIQGTNDIFRTAKPATPDKHLVSYFVVYDVDMAKIMLIDHIKANAWLPSGGHVEPGEDPRATVKREAYEELQLDAQFDVVGEKPLFITVTETKPPHTHTDVSLWYVIKGDSTKRLVYDPLEMRSYKWFTVDEIMDMDDSLLDPHMKRFTRKLQGALSQ